MINRPLLALTLAAVLVMASFTGGSTQPLLSDTETVAGNIAVDVDSGTIWTVEEKTLPMTAGNDGDDRDDGQHTRDDTGLDTTGNDGPDMNSNGSPDSGENDSPVSNTNGGPDVNNGPDSNEGPDTSGNDDLDTNANSPSGQAGNDTGGNGTGPIGSSQGPLIGTGATERMAKTSRRDLT